MKVTQRQVVIVLFSLLVAATLVIGLDRLVQQRWIEGSVSLVGTIVYTCALLAYWRGLQWTRYSAVVLLPLATGFTLQEPFVTEYAPFALAVAPVVAALLSGPLWIIIAMVTTHAILLGRGFAEGAGFDTIYAKPEIIAISSLVAGCLVLSRLITDRALHTAETNAREAEKALARAEQQGEELAQQASELRQQNEQQQQLIDLVATLETPVVALAEGVLLAPIVGHLDSRRAQLLTTRILQAVSEQRTRLVILDIAGVTTVDTQVAHALLQATQAVRLLGCAVTITGISASVATTITHLGIALDGMTTARTPQDALANVMAPNGTSNGLLRLN